MAHVRRFLAGKPVNVGTVTRAELLGQGVFETMRWQGGIPLLPWHVQRLKKGALQLGYDPQLVIQHFMTELEQVTADLALHVPYVVRYQLSHTQSERGYASKMGDLVGLWQVSEASPEVVSYVPLARFDSTAMPTDICPSSKHSSRIDQVLAADRSQNAVTIRCDAQGFVREGLSSNLFFTHHGVVYTPRLDHWGVAGVMRSWLIEHLRSRKIPVVAGDFMPSSLLAAESVWLTNAVRGLQVIETIDRSSFTITSPMLKHIGETVFELFYENP